MRVGGPAASTSFLARSASARSSACSRRATRSLSEDAQKDVRWWLWEFGGRGVAVPLAGTVALVLVMVEASWQLASDGSGQSLPE